MEGGWHPHPDAIDHRTDLLPVEPGHVVGIGAICDLRSRHLDEAGAQSFSVGEFVALEDGRRVLLHEDRGFTIGWQSADHPRSDAVPIHETRDSITQTVLNVVLPDNEENTEDHPWSWLADLAQARGLNVTAEDLRALPYEVVLTDRVTQWLTST